MWRLKFLANESVRFPSNTDSMYPKFLKTFTFAGVWRLVTQHSGEYSQSKVYFTKLFQQCFPPTNHHPQQMELNQVLSLDQSILDLVHGVQRTPTKPDTGSTGKESKSFTSLNRGRGYDLAPILNCQLLLYRCPALRVPFAEDHEKRRGEKITGLFLCCSEHTT